MKWGRFFKDFFKDIKAKWALVYKTVDATMETPQNTLVFGATSFNGVFTPEGFKSGSFALICEDNDNIDACPVIKEATEENARVKAKDAAKYIKDEIGNPSVILMHATPGFEERILEGIDDVFGKDVPVYGGSAADNDLSGKWYVFMNDQSISSGFLLVGFRGKAFGNFLSGYLPTDKKGKITKAKGRVVYEIDGKPAAHVYNEWTGGAIEKYLTTGGVVLAETTLRPVGRVIGEVMGYPKYLLSHPHMVIAENKALTFFTEFKKGDEIVLMSGTRGALIKRSRQVVDMSLKGRYYNNIKGAILVYCAGCVGAIMDEVDKTISEYKQAIGNNVPFIGCATFGEQGCFLPEKENRHGNLMADTIIFVE